MIAEKCVLSVKSNKVKRLLNSDKNKNSGIKLASNREIIALELLHTMFLKSLAEKSNLEAFKVKKIC